MNMMRKIIICFMVLSLLECAVTAFAEDDEDILIESVLLDEDGEEVPDEILAEEEHTPRDEWIDRIVSLAEQKYTEANGKAKRAHYSSDIYVCKNFTVYLFRETRDDFRMAEYPDVQLKIPNNLEAKKCKPYYYGIFWEDIPAEKGNPFYVADQFLYDSELSYDENLELAKAFMRNAQRGDYFQMSADYASGVGAHSAIMLDYDAQTDEIHWMDSNMRGKKINGIRYGYVQFDEVKSAEWWAKAFCHKKRGATLYRLRDDIIFAPETQK